LCASKDDGISANFIVGRGQILSSRSTWKKQSREVNTTQCQKQFSSEAQTVNDRHAPA
jgi:hypothetical protein